MNDKEMVLAEIKRIIEKHISRERVTIIWESCSGPTDPFWPCLNCDVKHDTIYIYVEDGKILIEILGHAWDEEIIPLADPDSLDEDRIMEIFTRLYNND